MSCEHWFKFDGVCKHCGYQKPIPDLGLVPLRTKPPQANQAGVVKPIIPVMRTALERIQELHKPKHGERPIYAYDDYHAEREPVRWHKYTICTNCHSEYPCATRKLADDGLAGSQ